MMIRSCKTQRGSVCSPKNKQQDLPVARLNYTYDLLKKLGQGLTASVWLARNIQCPNSYFAIKIISKQYLNLKKSRKRLKNEIEIHQSLNHDNIIRMYEHGQDGVLQKSNSKFLIDQHYIVMEYSNGPLLFDLYKRIGSMGERMGFYFA